MSHSTPIARFVLCRAVGVLCDLIDTRFCPVCAYALALWGRAFVSCVALRGVFDCGAFVLRAPRFSVRFCSL